MAERPPFDPRRIRRPAAAPAAASGPLSVRQVNELVRGAIAQHLPATLAVLGELGDFRRPTSGHLYFALKDATSELRCVMWRSSAAHLRFAPELGMEVIATGSLEVYTPRGQYQLVVRKLEPRGVGALEVAFRQLKEKLEREGLFDPARKRPIPRIPQRIALVTSPTGAAIRDILHTLQRRFPVLQIYLLPVRVQGAGAAAEIAAAIALLNRQAAALGGIDVAIVGRGGGALEDLWAFNEEAVARAIAASRVPIVSAVGHETDVTISDLVADLRAPTPTAAAELITPQLGELLEALRRLEQQAQRRVLQAVQTARREWQARLRQAPLARPLAATQECAQRVDEAVEGVQWAWAQQRREARERLAAAEAALARFRTGARFVRADRDLHSRLHQAREALHGRLMLGERNLAHRLARVEQRSPRLAWRAAQDRLRRLPGALRAALRLALQHHRRLLELRLESAAACDPRQVLRRGYSLARNAHNRRVIRSVGEVRDKLRVIVELADGEFRATADDPQQPQLFE